MPNHDDFRSHQTTYIKGITVNVFIGISFLVGGLGLTICMVSNTIQGRPLLGREKKKPVHVKMVIDPKQAIHEPGICQCNCALAYHRGQGACEVPGCPCQQFIPSTLSSSELQEITDANITRFAVQGVEERVRLEAARLDLEAKTKMLEVQAKARISSSGRPIYGDVVDAPVTWAGKTDA